MINAPIAILLSGSMLAGCVAEASETTSTADQALIDDATTSIYSTPGFYFQPPLVDTVVTGGAFDTTLAPRLTVDLAEVDCSNAGVVGATVHTFSTVQMVPSTKRKGEHRGACRGWARGGG